MLCGPTPRWGGIGFGALSDGGLSELTFHYVADLLTSHLGVRWNRAAFLRPTSEQCMVLCLHG